MQYFYCHIHPVLSCTDNKCSPYQSPAFGISPPSDLYSLTSNLPSFSPHFKGCCCMDFPDPFVTLFCFRMETLRVPNSIGNLSLSKHLPPSAPDFSTELFLPCSQIPFLCSIQLLLSGHLSLKYNSVYSYP